MRKLLIMLMAFAPLSSLGAAAPDWILTSSDGEEIVAKNVWREGPTIMLFWASWCPYCKALMPHLQSMLHEFNDDDCPLKVYAFSYREDGDPVAIAKERGLDFTIFPDPRDLPEQMGVVAMPGLFIIDTRGEILLDLYEVTTDMQTDAGWAELSHREKAARRAPYWADRIRETLNRFYEGLD
ncbi:MAG: TlpA family protein disulfide reductase [Gammaproteobacteria bacterium]|nr:TlpA family protein disulfide reductase [Gammaproteobacteria bacterium]